MSRYAQHEDKSPLDTMIENKFLEMGHPIEDRLPAAAPGRPLTNV